MPKSTFALATPLRDQLERLTAFDPTDAPVLSLYLDMRADHEGRHPYDAFLRKTFAERSRLLTGDARKSFDKDAERITSYLDDRASRSARAIAIFACSAAGGYFEAIELEATMDGHWLFIGSVPHLYPLARLNDQFPRYAALLVDTNSARLFVFSLGAIETRHRVANIKTRRSMSGGWSQARYQRHLDNFHAQHMKEVADVLDRVVREEQIGQIIVACDPIARPALMEQLPSHLAEKIVNVVNLSVHTPEREILQQTLDVLRHHDEDTDAARVQALRDAWLGNGLGVVGPDATLRALSLGEVEELLIAAIPDRIAHAASLPPDTPPGPVDVDTSTPATALDPDRLKLADELVTRAQRQSARIRFIENSELLKDLGGVGALLRFKSAERHP
jgi:peptide chain release factor subunit 1